MKRFFKRLFPTPRYAVSWKDALPLVVFLLVFGGGCLYLELADHLMFVQPLAFLLLLVTPWIWWMNAAGFSGLTRGRAMVSLLVRLTVVGLFVILIAEPRAVRTKDVISTVFAIDISDSVDQTLDSSLQFVSQTVRDKVKEEDEAGLVVFARNAAVELPPRQTFPFEGAVNARIGRDATNIEQTLSLSAALLKEENRGRIVLISDGTETSGHMREVLDDLKSREIAVDVLPIEYKYDSEVLLERLDLPRYVKIGENYEADVVMSSRKAGKGRLILKENGEEIFNDQIEFPAGKKRITLPIKLREPGYYEYTATIRPEADIDHIDANNTVRNFIFIEGEGKVLLVYDPDDDLDRGPLVTALEDGERFVETMASVDFPRSSLSLMSYDAIVFNNVPADHFDSVQMQAVHDAVYHLGIGFMMVGGRNSFGPGGYHHTPIEEALPVSMDITKKKVLPKGALAIILHTCEFPEGNTWAKRITKRAIKVLGEQDEVGAIGYDFQVGEKWIFELTPAGEYDKLVPQINAAQIGDMPSFDPTMQMGLNALKKSDAAAKHMIIISDGDPPIPQPKLLEDFKAAGVSVSTVAVFPHGGRDIQSMQVIASVTGGRFYFPDDPNQLPAIFIKEAKTLKRSMIQNKTITPQLEFDDGNIMKGIEGLPPLHGYVLASTKPSAKTVLRVPEEEEGEVDPILSVWQYGLGVSAAFTSDFSPNWGKDWAGWEQLNAFLKQTMIRVSRVRQQGHLRMWNYVSGNDGVIVVEDFHPESTFLDVQAVVSRLDAGSRRPGPVKAIETPDVTDDYKIKDEDAMDNATVERAKRDFRNAETALGEDGRATLKLQQVGPRRYQARIPLDGQGRYQVMAVAQGGERKETVQGGMIVPYSPEYLRFESNHVALQEIAAVTGGKVLNPDSGAEDIYGERDPKRSSWPVFDWFLISLAILIPVDVGIRRVQLDWSVVKGWFGLSKKAESTATMGTLLQRKQAVGSKLEKGKSERPLPQRSRPMPGGCTGPRQRPDAVQPKSSDPTETRQTPAPDSNTTTSRLLQLKRKREEDGSEE
ncbi:MAG: VWA domain-containing protein [Planctomycetaceae bacterium]